MSHSCVRSHSSTNLAAIEFHVTSVSDLHPDHTHTLYVFFIADAHFQENIYIYIYMYKTIFSKALFQTFTRDKRYIQNTTPEWTQTYYKHHMQHSHKRTQMHARTHTRVLTHTTCTSTSLTHVSILRLSTSLSWSRVNITGPAFVFVCKYGCVCVCVCTYTHIYIHIYI